MVSPTYDSGESLATAPVKIRVVLVPVFLQVGVLSEDEFDAEAQAVNLVKQLKGIKIQEGSEVSFRSLIGPLCQG